MVMVKTHLHSHFEMISSSYLELYGDRIVQIDSVKLFDNSSGNPVFLCEVLPENEEVTE